MPVLFSVISYALLFVALRPVWELSAAAAGMVMAKETPTFQAHLTSSFNREAAAATPVQNQEPSGGDTQSEAPYIRIQDIQLPDDGEHYANLSCERIGLDAPVYWDDTSAILRAGVGHYLASTFPGYGGLIVLSGHNTTFFKPLQDIEAGDIIHYDTNYCNYEYEVTDVEVLNENVLNERIMKNLMVEEEKLVMYTCYPFGPHAGRKTDRLTVTAKRISGYDVRWRSEANAE